MSLSRHARRTVALAAVLVLGGPLAACGGDDEATPPPAGDGQAAAGEASTDGGGAGGEDDPGNGPATTVEVPSGLPAAIELDLQDNHPNGASVIVRGVSFHDDRIQLDVAVTNGAAWEIDLSRSGRMNLRDNLGNVYRLSAPSSNPRVTIPREQTVEGTFVFLGRVAPGAGSLTLTTNSTTTGDRSDRSRTPRFVVEGIPVERDGSSSGDADDDGGSE